MKNIFIISIICMAVNSFGGMPDKVQYWYYHNVANDIPKFKKIVTIANERNGTKFLWKIANPPSQATLAAIDDTVATDFITDYWEDKRADPEDSSIDAQALITTIAEITGTPEGQVKAKFKKNKKAIEKK